MEQSNWEQQRQVQEFLSKLCSDTRKAGEAALLTHKDGYFEEPKHAALALVRLIEETEVPLRPELKAELLKHATKARDTICNRNLYNSIRIDWAYYSLGDLYRVAAEELLILDVDQHL